MGLKGRLFWRRLFWRVRAAVKKAREGRRWRKRGSIRFQYDPSSYALNFDDGSKPNYWEEETSTNLAHGGKGNVFQHLNFHLLHSNPTTIVTATTTTCNNTIWVYVFWVKI